jgi:hypothetical protein
MIHEGDMFTITAIESGVSESSLNADDLQRLFTAIDPRYPEYEKKIEEAEQRLKDLGEETLFGYDGLDDAHCGIVNTRQTAYFNLGFQTAVRLLGRSTPPPRFKAVG